MSDGPHAARVAPGKRVSIALAVAVHLLLAVFLIYGIRWQTKATDVVEVELVQAVPTPMSAAAEPAPAPAPKPTPEPKVEPKPAPPPPKPDIAIKEKPKPAKEEPRPKFDPMAFIRNALNSEDKDLTSRKASAKSANEKATQEAAARGKAVASYVDRIRSKIRGNIVLPPDLQGNPVAKFEVVQLPTGEVISVRLVKTSGHSGYDAAVERAILKSSPLPKPDDPAFFDRSLKLTFCPQESGCMP